MSERDNKKQPSTTNVDMWNINDYALQEKDQIFNLCEKISAALTLCWIRTTKKKMPISKRYIHEMYFKHSVTYLYVQWMRSWCLDLHFAFQNSNGRRVKRFHDRIHTWDIPEKYYNKSLARIEICTQEEWKLGLNMKSYGIWTGLSD